MKVDGMDVAGGVGEGPDFGGTGFGIFGDGIVPVFLTEQSDHGVAVGRAIHFGEGEDAFANGGGWIQRGPGNECVGEGTVVFGGDGFGDFEEHDFGGDDFSAAGVGSLRVIDEGEVHALVLGEIDDEIEALTGRNDQVVQADGRGQEAAVGSDLAEGWGVGGAAVAFAGFVGGQESEVIEAGVGAVDEAEAVFARGNFQKRSRFAVYADGFAEE